MDFEVLGEIRDIELIAAGRSIHDLRWLRRQFGASRWKKLKGIANVLLLSNGDVRMAELHWYEAHGVGKRMMRIKRFLD